MKFQIYIQKVDIEKVIKMINNDIDEGYDYITLTLQVFFNDTSQKTFISSLNLEMFDANNIFHHISCKKDK